MNRQASQSNSLTTARGVPTLASPGRGGGCELCWVFDCTLGSGGGCVTPGCRCHVKRPAKPQGRRGPAPRPPRCPPAAAGKCRCCSFLPRCCGNVGSSTALGSRVSPPAVAQPQGRVTPSRCPSSRESSTAASTAPAGMMPTQGQGPAAKAAAAAVQVLGDRIRHRPMAPPSPDPSPYGGGETPCDLAPARKSIWSHLSRLVNHLGGAVAAHAWENHRQGHGDGDNQESGQGWAEGAQKQPGSRQAALVQRAEPDGPGHGCSGGVTAAPEHHGVGAGFAPQPVGAATERG